MILQIILIGAGYHVKRNEVIITEWASVLILTCFARLFRRVFKYIYLKGKANKRVNKCLVDLIKFNRDKTFERIKKLTEEKLTQKLSMIQSRHRNSLNLDSGSVT